MRYRTLSNDGRPVWKVIFDYLAEQMASGRWRIGDVIAHDAFKTPLSEAQQASYASAMLKVREALQKEHHRTLNPVPGRGYHLVAGVGQTHRAKKMADKTRRAAKRAHNAAITTDLSGMTPEQIREHTKVEMRTANNLATSSKRSEKKLEQMARSEYLKSASSVRSARCF